MHWGENECVCKSTLPVRIYGILLLCPCIEIMNDFQSYNHSSEWICAVTHHHRNVIKQISRTIKISGGSLLFISLLTYFAEHQQSCSFSQEVHIPVSPTAPIVFYYYVTSYFQIRTSLNDLKFYKNCFFRQTLALLRV